AWVPLLCLAAVERLGPGQGVGVSFLGSISTHVRFLVTLPLVFATEVWVSPRLRHFVRDAIDTRIVPDAEVPALERTISLAHRLRDRRAGARDSRGSVRATGHPPIRPAGRTPILAGDRSR